MSETIVEEQIDQAIKEIALKHQITLTRDDPLFVLLTMNKGLIEETHKSQEKLINQFKEEMEVVFQRWRQEAIEKAEIIMNKALVQSEAILNERMEENVKTIIYEAQQELLHQVEKRRETEKHLRELIPNVIFFCVCGFFLYFVVQFF